MSYKQRAQDRRAPRRRQARRLEADELTFRPGEWGSHFRKIKLFYGSSMIKYLLERKITSPLFDRDLARELMDDEGREQENRPDLPAASNVPYRFWHLNTADTLDEFIAQSNNENFNTIRLQLIAAHNQAGAGEEAQVQVEEQAAFEPQRDAIQQRAHGTIVRWYNATKEWRENNASDIHKVQKLIDLLRKAGNNASYLPQWTHQPIHIRTFVFDALNTKLYGFFQNYVGTNTYRHILELPP